MNANANNPFKHIRSTDFKRLQNYTNSTCIGITHLYISLHSYQFNIRMAL